jgi:hypothetical protein
MLFDDERMKQSHVIKVGLVVGVNLVNEKNEKKNILMVTIILIIF